MSGAVKMDVEQGLSLLFTQLTWPSGLVRERACVQIAKLLLDPEYSDATLRHLLLWMKSQKLETVNALGLLTLLRAQLDGRDFILPHLDELAAAVVRPSLLSALLLHELSPNDPEIPLSSLGHSGEVPRDFSPNPFFAKYVETFLPPMFNFQAGLIEERELIAFRRHWAYEWEGLVDQTDVKLTDRNLYFWWGSPSDKERVLATDTKLSEVYRSAYLRALAWAVSTERLAASAAVELAVGTCPINLDLWRVKPVSKPDWFPLAEEPIGNIDTVPAQVWRQVEKLWEGQLDDRGEWRIAQTSGVVLDGKTVYDLEIYGLFQKSHGPRQPNLEKVAEWCHDEVQLSAQMQEPLHFRGRIRQEMNKTQRKVFDDWSFSPAFGSVYEGSIGRWQIWRMFRRVWLPTPSLASKLDFSCNTDGVNAYQNGEIIARWFDWIDALTERHHVDLPMSTGQCLQIRRKTIEEFAKSSGSTFCWVCRITGYHRKDTYESYKQVRDHRSFGCTRLATA
jgi:hypothetical protein